MQEISKSNLYTYIILSISNLKYSLYHITSIHNFLLNEYFNKSNILLKKKKSNQILSYIVFYVLKEDLFLTYILKKVIHINLIYNKTFGYGEDWCLVFAMI